jgi:YD repeat-containing protein
VRHSSRLLASILILLALSSLPSPSNADATSLIPARPSAVTNSGPASNTSGASEMQYDPAGNLTSMPVNDASYSSLSGTTTYAYNSENELTQESSTRNGGYTENFAYDGVGNATEFRNVTGITYNADNQLSGSGFAYDGYTLS